MLAFTVVTLQVVEKIRNGEKWFQPPDVICCVLFLLLVFFRLAFVNKSIFPSYVDSATHFEIIQKLIDPETGTSVSIL